MKIQYKLGLMAMGLLAFTSCEKHDLVADNMAIGQRVPTVYWALGSTACKAGESFSFEGQYYTEDGHTPDHSEVWYSVIRSDEAKATVKLISSLSYTKQVTITDTIRPMLCMATFPHSMAVWQGHQFVLNGEVPTSSTLAPLSWQHTDAEWTDLAWTRFRQYFPEGFDTEFLAEVKAKLQDSSNEAALRDMFINYKGFDGAYMEAINAKHGTALPTVFDDDEKTKDILTKGEQWYRISDTSTDDEKKAALKAYYYVDDAGVEHTVEKESVTKDEATGNIIYNDNGVNRFCYAVYDASPWLYCRFNNDKGTVVTTVIDDAKYKAAFSEMIDCISFPEWILGQASEGYYVATFSRKHVLSTVFKVVDTEGNIGVYTTPYEVTLN